ncbi:MAG TPA: hypothetical protein VF060_04030 [Trebonia sp.]
MDVENLLAKASESLSVRRAFGAPYEKNGMLIIPVAMVFSGGGAGTSPPRRRDPAARHDNPPEKSAVAPDAAPQDSGRTDEGGGFGGLVLPSGAYVVKGDEVRWVPAVDVTIVVLASLSLVRALARTWIRRRRRRARA